MLRYMTAGESHGKGIMAVLDGMPAGLAMDEDFINEELSRRMIGYGRGKRMSIEKDRVDIIAGCRRNLTIGSPVGMMIRNRDHSIDELPDVKCPRPGHADLAGIQKYGLKDARDVLERASARETAARVAVGAVAKLILKEFGMRILSHVTMIGAIEARTEGLSFDELWKLAGGSDLRCADKEAAKRMRAEIDRAREAGDTVGGSFEVIAADIPPGLGSYAQWDRRLDGALARSVMAIPAVKAVSIGSGIESAAKKGSQTHDAIAYDDAGKRFVRSSNSAGGLEGGVTNASSVVIRGFMKPIATLCTPLKSVDIDTKKESTAATERADVTAVPACGVVAESAVAFEIASAFLEKFGGDSMAEVRRNYRAYMEHLRQM
ncbi:MAG: chorismate synthase [Candidatus Makaraimicrobium thalassicum]|nr:MAG: chorismate synthase [Candidatus Omnitrophota bacterium]